MTLGWLPVTYCYQNDDVELKKNDDVLHLGGFMLFILRFISADLSFVIRQMNSHKSSEDSQVSG